MKKKPAAITASRRAAPERDVVGLADRGRRRGAGGRWRRLRRGPPSRTAALAPSPSIAGSPARRGPEARRATAVEVLARRPTMVVELALVGDPDPDLGRRPHGGPRPLGPDQRSPVDPDPAVGPRPGNQASRPRSATSARGSGDGLTAHIWSIYRVCMAEYTTLRLDTRTRDRLQQMAEQVGGSMVELVKALSRLQVTNWAEEVRLRIFSASPADAGPPLIVDGGAVTQALGASAPPAGAKAGSLVYYQYADGSRLVLLRGDNDSYHVWALAPGARLDLLDDDGRDQERAATGVPRQDA